jgi:hypothetical protein
VVLARVLIPSLAITAHVLSALSVTLATKVRVQYSFVCNKLTLSPTLLQKLFSCMLHCAAISRNVDMCLSDSTGVLSISTFLVSTPTLTVAFWLRYTNIGDSSQVLSLFGTEYVNMLIVNQENWVNVCTRIEVYTVGLCVTCRSQQSLIFNSILATFDSDSVVIYLADDSILTLPYAKPIKDGVWHYVTLTLSSSGGQSRVAVYVDTVTSTDATATNIANVNLALPNQ